MTETKGGPHMDEESLLAVAQGLARPRAASHLRACRRCREASALYGALEVVLGHGFATARCPEAEELVRHASATTGAVVPAPAPFAAHLASCADCRGEVAALRRIERGAGRPPLAPRRAGRARGLVERLRALVRFEIPLPLVLNPRGPRVATGSEALREGLREMRARRFPRARAAFQRARRAGDASPAVDFYLGVLLFEQGRPAAAARLLERAAHARHRSAEARFFLAQTWLARGRAAEALDELRAVARLAGPHRQAALKLAARVEETLSSAP